MRLLYLGMRWDYGDPARGESFEHWNFYHSLRTFCLQRGWTFQYYDFMERGRAIGQEAMTEELYATCLADRPDYLFSVLFAATHDPLLPVFRAISDLGTVAINWFCDDHWRYERYSSQVAPYFDLVCTTATSALPKYQSDGLAHKVIKSQWACNHELYRPTGRPLDIPVSFVGMNHGNREALLKQLQHQGLDIAIFGHGWVDRPRLDFAGMVDLFNRSRINLNLSNSSVMTGQQIKGRNFEVPGCRAFLLSGAAENLDDYFIDGKETVVYRDEAELPEMTRFYLTHEAERARIAEAGYRRVLAEHTWHHRFAEIFARVAPAGTRGTSENVRSLVLADAPLPPSGSVMTASSLAEAISGSDWNLTVVTPDGAEGHFHGGLLHRSAKAVELMNLAHLPPAPDVFCAVSAWELYRTVLLPESTLKAVVVTDTLPDRATIDTLDLVFCLSTAMANRLQAMGVSPHKLRVLPPGAKVDAPPANADLPRGDSILLASPAGAADYDPRPRAVRLAMQHRPDVTPVSWQRAPNAEQLSWDVTQASLVLFPEIGGWPGLTPLLAQRLGCIPIIPAAHPLSETVVNGHTGVVLAHFEVADIALAILQLLSSPSLGRMRSAAMAHAANADHEIGTGFRTALHDALKLPR